MRKLYLGALALILSISGAWAADQQVETVLSPQATVDGENAGGTAIENEDADAYAVRYFDRFGDSWLSWGFGMERLELSAVDAGAYMLEGGLRAEVGPTLFGAYASGGLGVMISDVQVVEREVVTTSTTEADSNGNHSTTVTTESESTVEQTEQETAGTWHLEAGIRGAFTEGDRLGWLLAYKLAGPTGEGFTLDEAHGVIFALTIPVSAAGGTP